MKSLMAILITLISTHAWALGPTIGAAEIARTANDQEYENYRHARAESAATYEEFLQWATPAEIAADLEMDPDEAVFTPVNIDPGAYALQITVRLSTQTMDVVGEGFPPGYRVRVASGRPGYVTPRGCRAVLSTERNHWSRKYKAPMPYSTFFRSGIALHVGSLSVKSHGCVHLAPDAARLVYTRVNELKKNAVVCVVP